MHLLSPQQRELVMALFALNRRYFVNDKTALAEVSELKSSPRDFERRAQSILSQLDTSSKELGNAVQGIAQLLRETKEQAGELYHSRFSLPR